MNFKKRIEALESAIEIINNAEESNKRLIELGYNLYTRTEDHNKICKDLAETMYNLKKIDGIYNYLISLPTYQLSTIDNKFLEFLNHYTIGGIVNYIEEHKEYFNSLKSIKQQSCNLTATITGENLYLTNGRRK